MDRRTVRVALVALLCVAAVGVAAATLNTTQQTGGGAGPGSAGGTGGSDTEGDSVVPLRREGDFRMQPMDVPWPCIGLLRSPVVLLGVFGSVLGIGAVLVRRRNVLVASLVLLAIGVLVGIPYALLAACPTNEGAGNQPPDANVNATLVEGGGLPGTNTGPTPVPPSMLVVVLLGTILLVAAVAVFYSTDDDEVEMTQPEPTDEEERVEEIARVAGEAADRIDAAGDVDNEVYRAWREMVAQLGVESPTAMTPGEFADAAVDAGMDRRDVDELTDLFEAVRYGGFDPTDDRERRALDALRRIEREYAEDDR